MCRNLLKLCWTCSAAAYLANKMDQHIMHVRVNDDKSFMNVNCRTFRLMNTIGTLWNYLALILQMNATEQFGLKYYLMFEWHSCSQSVFIRVTTLPGKSWKSWNLVRQFSRPGKSWKTAKVMESHEKSWKVMEKDDDILEFCVKMHYNFCFCKYHPVCSWKLEIFLFW